MAFTGTPVASADRDTRQVFGDEIDIYDMIQANDDGATVPIFYESRLFELELTDSARTQLLEEGYDADFGARPMKRVFQKRIQDPLALSLLSGKVGGDPGAGIRKIRVGYDAKKEAFSFE